MATEVTTERVAPHTVRDSCEEYRCEEYPCADGDRISESSGQYLAIFDTFAALKTLFGDRPDVFVAGNMFVYFREGDATSRVAPDIMVVFGANGSHFRHSWQVWREGGAVPTFVLEIASPSTWRTDAGRKRDIYAAMGVSEYWRHDPFGDLLPTALIGERLVDGEYRPMSLYTDGSGTIRGHSPILGLDICVRDGSDLRLYDPAAGQWLLSPDEKETELSEQAAELSEQAAELSEQATELSEQAAELSEAQAELREAQAEIGRLRARLEA